MPADEARDEFRAPLGCRDPQLWATAEELLAVHDAELAACVACRDGAPCTLVRCCVEAQDRAMEPFTTRWLRGDDYLVKRVYTRVVGRAKVRQCPTQRPRVSRWLDWARRGRRPR
jgi:hypothetical protein